MFALSTFAALARFSALVPVLTALVAPGLAVASVSIAPSPSYTGDYTVSWTDMPETGQIMYLAQSINAGAWTRSRTSTTTSKAFTGMAVADYSYKVQFYEWDLETKREYFSHETAPVAVKVWKSIPGVPGPITGPAVVQPGSSFSLSWTAPPGVVTRYEVVENGTKLSPDPSTTTVTLTRWSGTNSYVVRACNGLGCGPYAGTFRVTVAANLTSSVSDALSAPLGNDEKIAQGSVGRIEAHAAADGGAASYRIDIEVPPGRAGIQPSVALAYSSRSGNGIAGVGWQLSAAGSIYRCPGMLETEGASRPVRMDALDHLCFEGRRLVATSGVYGALNSIYRTEIDSFARLTLKGGDIGSATSWFQVEYKSGRIARYEPPRKAVGDPSPASWVLVSERDPQNNCVAYNYTAFSSAAAGLDQEFVLSSIVYTGADFGYGCIFDADPRKVAFTYTADREDKRTTYAAGVATISTARLSTITTYVGASPVLQYGLSYKVSNATRRSLLASVTKCATTGCQGGGGVGATTFTYQEDAPFPGGTGERFDDPTNPDPNVKADVSWHAYLTDDFDGDGKRDAYIQRVYPDTRVVLLSKLGTASVGNGWVDAFDSSGTWAGGAIDVDEDGMADMVGKHQVGDTQYLAFASYGSGPAARVIDAVDASGSRIPVPAGAICRTVDYDGDGRVDVMCGKLLRGLGVAGCPNDCRPVFDGVGVDIPMQDPTCNATNVTMSADFNGDGPVDQYREWCGIAGTCGVTGIAYSTGGSAATSTSYINSLAWRPGGPVTPLQGTKYWMDANGDGLRDILNIGARVLWLNRGGAPGNHRFQQVDIWGVVDGDPARTLLSTDVPNGSAGFPMDVDGDGADELMVPAERTGAQYCRYLSIGNGERDWFCGYDDPPPPVVGDRSFFRWDAYKIRDRGDGNYWMIRVRTGLVAPGNVAKSPGDYDGDGMPDVIFHVPPDETETTSNGQLYVFGYYVPSVARGPVVATNRARAPDLLISATDGLGAFASWTYQPLSFKPTADTPRPGPSCAPADSAPFYVARNGDPKGSGYVFFTSSMWAVSEFDVSHGVEGVPTTAAATCYRYEDAMLHLRGRGFQGFKKIVAEQRLPRALGESGDAGGACGPGPCSANNLRTTTEFNQEFPFTDTPKKVTVERAWDSARLSETTTQWYGVPFDFTEPGSGKVNRRWVIYPDLKIAAKYEAGGPAPLVTTTTVTEVDTSAVEPTGEPKKTCTIVDDVALRSLAQNWATATPLPAGIQVTPITVSTEVRDYAAPDWTSWWLDKLNSSTVSTDEFTGSMSSTTQVPASCPIQDGSPSRKARVTTFDWYAASAARGMRRMLKSKAVAPEGATVAEQTTTFDDYDAYGNLKKQTVTARAVPVTGAPPVTAFTPSADGYFVEGVQNALGHVSTTRRDPATGQVTYQQDIQDTQPTTFTFDGVGRPLSATRQGSQTVNHRVAGCAPYGPEICATGEVMLRQTTQVGSPTKLEYLDRLGRVVRTATTGFDGRWVVTEVGYNQRGLKVAEYAPRFDGNAAYATSYAGFDHLGRPATKTVERAANIFASGVDTRPLTTRYQHTEIRTDIVADEGGPLPLSMSHTYDGGGRLVETTQRIEGRDVRARYVYDPAGPLTHVVDTAGNDLAAEYDAMGRKRKVIDPDRGTWLYDWDGLGRLLKQTDARANETNQEYDVIGRPKRRTLSKNGVATGAWAEWTFDLPGGLGLLGTETDSKGYERNYAYDALQRPIRVTTLIPAVDTKYTGKLNLTTEYGYDTRYGRLKALRYPTNLPGALGELVVLKYDGRGYQLGEAALNADYTEGTRYRQVRGMSERGQVIDQLLGRCVSEDAAYDPSTGMTTLLTATRDLLACPAPPETSTLVRQGEYRYDRFLNLSVQTKNVAGKQVEERYGYDELQRLRSAGRCEGAGCLPGAAQTDRYTYDDLGNLTSKSDYGTLYEYGTSARSVGLAGPHAVRRVTKTGGAIATFEYDLNGNLGSGDGRTVEFDEQDRPTRVITGGATSEFNHAPGGARYVQKVTGSVPPGFGPKTVYYVDKDVEITVWDVGSSQAGLVEERTFVGGSVVVLTSQSGATTTRAVLYKHADRLGSVEAVTKEDGSEAYVDAHGFDPWGKPRGRAWEPTGDRLHPGGEAGTESTRGFTGHEQLDIHYLTHMNGRVYDYRLGRFLSVDPIISNPGNPQSINPYSYIGNNPLSGVDPTGYQAATADDSKFTKLKAKTLSELRREGSIAGRGTTGSQFVYGGQDHDAAMMTVANDLARSMSCHASATSGPALQQPSGGGTTTAVDAGSPAQLAHGAAVSVGSQTAYDAEVRAEYSEKSSKLAQDDPTASAKRSVLKAEARARSTPGGAAIAEMMRPADGAPRSGGRVAVTNPGVNSAMEGVGAAGKGLVVLGAIASTYSIASAPEGQTARVVAQEAGGWMGAVSFGTGGGAMGAELGASIGVWFGGAGAIPGAVIGAVIGSFGFGALGSYVGRQDAAIIYDFAASH